MKIRSNLKKGLILFGLFALLLGINSNLILADPMDWCSYIKCPYDPMGYGHCEYVECLVDLGNGWYETDSELVCFFEPGSGQKCGGPE